MQQYQDGDTREIGGTTYVRQGGTWTPQSAASSPGIRIGSPNPRIAPEVARANQQVQAGQYDVARGPAQVQRENIGVTRDTLDVQHQKLVNQQLQQQVSAGPAGSAAESPAQAAGFYTRARYANEGYGQGVPPRGWLTQEVADILPQGLVNSQTSDKRKDAETYAREFIAATLRRESGAAINPEEYTNQYRRYFPVPGDGPEQIGIKAKLRQNALAALRLQAGPLGPQVDAKFGNAAPAGRDQPAPVTGATPPAQGGGPGGNPQTWRDMPSGGPEQGIAQGKTHDVFDAALSARGEQMIRGGASADQLNQMLVPRGYHPVNQAEIAAAQAYLKQHPNYRGIFQAIRTEALTGAARTNHDFANSAAGAAVGQYINDVTGNHLDNLANVAGGDGDLVNLGLSTARENHPYASFGGDLAAGASLYGAGRAVGGRVLGKVAQHLPSWAAPVIGDAAAGAYLGSGANGTEVFSPTSAAEGAAMSAGLGAAARGGINAVGRAVSPTGGNLAPLYEGNPEFRPSLGQRVGGAYNRFEEAHNSVPMLGGMVRGNRNAAIDQAQRGAFNQALGEIGSSLPAGVNKGVPAHAFMQREFNKAFSDVRANLSFAPDADFAKDFGQVINTAQLLDPSSQQVFRTLTEAFGHRLKTRGQMLSGQDYVTQVSRIDAKVRALRKNPRGDHELADVLDQLSNALDDAAARRSGPDVAQRLNAVRRGYAKSVIIENAGRTAGPAGEFSGAQLDNAVKQGSASVRSRAYLRGEAPMQDYAGAMRQLGDVVPDSGSIPRLLATGGAAGVAATHPAALIPSAGVIAANAPGVRNVIGAALAPNRPGMAGARKAIINRARLGSLFGVPLVESQIGQ